MMCAICPYHQLYAKLFFRATNISTNKELMAIFKCKCCTLHLQRTSDYRCMEVPAANCY